MECRRPLDAFGRSSAGSLLQPLTITLLLIPLFCSILASAQASSPHSAREDTLKKLFDTQRWQELVDAVQPMPQRSVEIDYYYGSALAQLSRWDQAMRIFLEAYRLQPRDKRFPTELAGVAFKQKNYSEAKRWLQCALRLDSSDAYVNDFLGTVYFLESNTESALKYWNRVEKPRVTNVKSDPQPRIDPTLLDRAFTFAPASTLQLQDLLTTKKRLQGLGVFPSRSLELVAHQEGDFDVVFHSQERNGFGANRWQGLLSIFSGVFYQTIYPEYFNVNRSAINIVSLVRWDDEKRRAYADVSGPLWRDPKYRWHAGLDLRNENWDIHSAFKGPSPLLGALNLRKEAASGEISSFTSGRWTWSTGAEFSHRDYRNVFAGTSLAPTIVLRGFQLKHLAQINYELWRISEHRFTVDSNARSELGAIWSDPRHTFEKIQGLIEAHWLPESKGDDYETRVSVRFGKTIGQLPFDELFMLGLERDNDLPLRAHIGTRDGKKGAAPLGRDYLLSNWETDKKVYSNGLIGVKLGPFLDTGKAFRTLNESRDLWLVDTGAQAKITILGVGVIFTYGKDLRTGNNAFYVRVGR